MRRLTILILPLLGTGASAPVPACSEPAAASPSRIVSLAPSVTEVLFAVGAGDRVVGVTDWCRRPVEVAGLPRVGGHVDPSLEAVAALRPDLVVLEEANADVRRRLERLGLNVLTVEHRNLAGVLESLTVVGEACGVADGAAALRAELEGRLETVRITVASRRPVRALLVVGRDIASGELRDVFAAGRGTFLGELLEAAGGVNACPVDAVRYPTLTREALMRLAPEVVVELAPELVDRDGAERLIAAWGRLGVPAARNGRVHVVLDDGPMIPGPGVIDTLEMLADLLEDAGEVQP